MRRRQFIKLIGGVAAAWPLVARGQITRTRPLVGRLSFGSRNAIALVEHVGMSALCALERHFAEGRGLVALNRSIILETQKTA